MTDKIFIGGGGEGYAEPQEMRFKYANRHGLIAGATGTGKTVTLQILAESFSQAGVPVILADVKGDLSGLAKAGTASHKLHEAFVGRAEKIGFSSYKYHDCPVTFWDLFGEQGHPVRTTVAEMGPLLLAQLLELSEAQEGILNIAFRRADEQALPLLDLKDLQALLVWIGENRGELSLRYGNVSPASVGAIQRRLLVLENQGGADLFGEPALALSDLTDPNGNPMAEVSLFRIDQPGGQAVAGATIIVPLETMLPAGLTISVDGAPGKRYNYSFCNPLGCVAQIGLTQSDIDTFKAGGEATLSLRPAPAPDQLVEMKMSLKGFTAGYNVVDVVQQ